MQTQRGLVVGLKAAWGGAAPGAERVFWVATARTRKASTEQHGEVGDSYGSWCSHVVGLLAVCMGTCICAW